ncbi:MAG: hypothetical protein HC906_13680 [Bacteroidales bacterium]|nr:hypothetical protein [Bacteroidales bacterium]
MSTLKYQIFFAIFITALFIRCEEYLEIEDLDKVVTEDTYTPEGVRMLDIGMFAVFKGDFNYFAQLYPSHCAGEYEFIEPTGEGPDHMQMWNLNYASSNNFFHGYMRVLIKPLALQTA